MNDCLKRLKITQLNDMQQATAEAIARGKGDVIVLSPTGSGKTLAYLLPLIQLTDTTNNEVQALVITPGRELALQSDGVLKAATTALRSTCCSLRAVYPRFSKNGLAVMDAWVVNSAALVFCSNTSQIAVATPRRW